MLATTNVKFRLFGANGLPILGALITAILTRQDTDGGSVCKIYSVQGVSNEDGECVLALWPNSRGTTGSQYSVSVASKLAVIDEYTITVPESLSTVLVESIKSTPPYPTVSAAQQALEAAQQAVIDAADASRLAIGTVTTLSPGAQATASITGDAGAQVLNLGIPKGDTGAGGEGEGGGGGATNLAYTASPTGGTVTSDTGTDATLPLADGTNAGLMAPAQHSKLAGIAAGATAVAVDAAPTDGSSNAVSSNGVFDALAGKADTGHNHSGVYDPAGTATSAVSNHAGASDPHGDRAWASGQFAATGHNHAGTYDPAGTASSALSAHTGAADPHPGYALESALGTAAVLNVPAAGNAASGEVVKGSDTRLSDARTPTAHTQAASTISDSTTVGRAVLTASDAAAARSAIGAGTSSFDGAYASLSGKPTLGDAATKNVGTTAGTVAAGDDSRLSDARTPTSHTHALADLTQSSASTGQVPTWNGSAWVPATPSAGGGSSNTRWIGAGELIPRVTNGAGIDGEELSTNKINLDYLAFDAGTAEYAQATFDWPSGFTTFTAKSFWTAASGSGAVVWAAQARCYADDDALDQAQGTAQTVTDTLLAANDAHLSSATNSITPGGTVAAGNLTVVQVYRDATNGSDTLAVDARLIGVLLTFA